MTDTYVLPTTFSMQEVMSALGITDETVTALIKAGRVGYSRGKGGSRRFSPAHVEQIREALEVKATSVADDDLLLIGATRASASRRRRRAS